MAQVAQSVLVEKLDFSRRKLADILSAEAYAQLKDVMLKAGFLRLKGKAENAGLELTPSGRAFLRQWL